MAITYKSQPWIYSEDGNVNSANRSVLMAASQTFILGSPMYISTSGTAKLEATATGSDDAIHGFFTFAAASALDVNTKKRITVANTAQIYAIYLSDNDSDEAAAQTLVGDQYGYKIDTTPTTQKGLMTLDVNNANKTMRIVDLLAGVDSNEYSTSDTQGVVLARFLPAVIDEDKA